MFRGGVQPRAWRAREREPITRVQGQSRPPEAEKLLASGCATEVANLLAWLSVSSEVQTCI